MTGPRQGNTTAKPVPVAGRKPLTVGAAVAWVLKMLWRLLSWTLRTAAMIVVAAFRTVTGSRKTATVLSVTNDDIEAEFASFDAGLRARDERIAGLEAELDTLRSRGPADA